MLRNRASAVFLSALFASVIAASLLQGTALGEAKSLKDVAKVRIGAVQVDDKVLIKAKNVQSDGIFELQIVPSAALLSVKVPVTWSYNVEDSVVRLRTDSEPVEAGSILRIHVKTDAVQLTFTWIALDEDGARIDEGNITAKVLRGEIVELEAGQEFDGLLVKSIDDSGKVTVDVKNCWGPACAMGRVSDLTLTVGERVTFRCDADALLLGITEAHAKFEIIKAHVQQCFLR